MIFIAGDIKLFDAAAAKKAGCSIEEYNEMVMTNWNKVVGENDMVVLLGEVSDGKFEETKIFFSKLNGNEFIYLNDNERTKAAHFTKNQFKEMGIQELCIHSVIYGDVQGNNQRIYVLSWDNKEMKNDFYCVSTSSVVGEEKNFSNSTLNADVSLWGYAPLKSDDVGKLITNCIEFENLEVENNEKR